MRATVFTDKISCFAWFHLNSKHQLEDKFYWTRIVRKSCGEREAAAARCETQGLSNQDRRKLLKRTRSLAVISEDLSRSDADNQNYHFSDSPLSNPRRPQLIPRAKLIDRNSLKDRLSKSQQHLSEPHDRFNESRAYHSHSTCDLYSIPPHSYFQEIPPFNRSESRIDPDRLNILNWPRTPRRYKSHQDLDTVSGLVDIVEDTWPLEENHQTYDIYTQVKRKRKKHRSLDSILFEDEGELEYFDVLNLLPLSKVRLEIDEVDVHNNYPTSKHNKDSLLPTNIDTLSTGDNDDTSIGGESELRHTPRILQVSEFSDDNQDNSLHFGSNVTDEEKCKSHSIYEETEKSREKSHSDENSWKSLVSSSNKSLWDVESLEESLKSPEKEQEQVETEAENTNNSIQETTKCLDANHKKKSTESKLNGVGDTEIKEVKEIEQVEDYKSIWVSDTDEIEDMSRRPQVLKIVDNEVTRRCSRGPSVVEIDIVAQDMVKSKDTNDEVLAKKDTTVDPLIRSQSPEIKKEIEVERSQECKRSSIESARNFFEAKSLGTESIKNQQNEGPFERIVKETTNIIGKACNAVKGSLGFEARSESSDLGLGSDCGSDTRRRSIDDGDEVDTNEDVTVSVTEKTSANEINDSYLKPPKSNLTRSHSCVDSIECQGTDGPEFDHIRYKIVKSRLFGKNIFSNAPGKGDPGYDGLMQYLREYSFQELLLDNNVVIIEPVRAEPVETKNVSLQNNKNKTTLSRGNSIVQKKAKSESDQNDSKTTNETAKSPKQSSLRKHFFYHPISSVNRVNKELIDEELPDPDTVRNVRRMFEATLRPKNSSDTSDSKDRKSVSMKDLRRIEDRQMDDVNERSFETSRFRCSSRAKDLTKLFEGLDKTTSTNAPNSKEDLGNLKSDSKTRILAQSFEARSGNTSPSDSEYSRNKNSTYRQSNHRQRQQSCWDAGSVSSGVSSDYPDTDPGSGVQCTSSEDEEIDCRDDDADRNNEQVHGHFVSQDVLERIRECGTSVTYYGGKVVNTCNGPLISPMSTKLKRSERLVELDDYVKFRLVKSNSCDSRLELTGRVVERRSKIEAREHLSNNESKRKSDLRACTIAETPSIEITDLESLRFEDERQASDETTASKREPPVVIGLEPKKEENRDQSAFKANFQLGKVDNTKSNIPHGFGSALTRWQINEGNWNKKQTEFGKMEFEEFEVLEDSLNGINN
ncbi:uncharacterized protein jv [Chelonus insularis]|uniref:uncharacterized protein jv n=1 Tax=Chelonus insularis TaxID=460826 RepID=UPI00158CF6DD|nr:uncharacterized protein LOC118068135 [Chelonus insularis]